MVYPEIQEMVDAGWIELDLDSEGEVVARLTEDGQMVAAGIDNDPL